ncbi:MAG: hypothetical protein M1839_005020 [Geoglossum umbratile]|nr:MAG: hypothetical protein M1839_005020 [Geoglossum umbratile]
MLPDPITLCVSIARVFECAHRYSALDREMYLESAALDDTSDVLSDVVSTYGRVQKFIGPELERRTDRIVRRTTSALEDARRMINLGKTHSKARTIVAKIEWMVGYRRYKERVKECRATLFEIKRELSAVADKPQLRALEEYFRGARNTLFAELARRVPRSTPRYISSALPPLQHANLAMYIQH